MPENDTQREVLAYIESHEPVEQDKVEERFGTRGLIAVRRLMQMNEVSYDIDWNLQTE